MKLCAIYARVSSNLQDIENSISAQIRICSEYAQKKSYSISGIYSDEAESGASTIKRAEFNRLLEDAREKKFDIILADKTDRFSRNKEDSITEGLPASLFKEKLEQLTIYGESQRALAVGVCQTYYD